MAKRRLSRDELLSHRDEHLEFIEASAKAYDAGRVGEAKRIAVSLRVLFHQTAQSHSILAQLGERQREMLDTSFPFIPEGLMNHYGLVSARTVVTAVKPATLDGQFIPNLDSHPFMHRRTKFSDWWEKDIILRDTADETYTRRALVLYAANKDGGAHVDPEISPRYHALKDGSGTGLSFASPGSGEKPFPGLIGASIRQIAHEVLVSLKSD